MTTRKPLANLQWYFDELRKVGRSWHKVRCYDRRKWQALERRGLTDFRQGTDLDNWVRSKPKRRPPRRPRPLRIESRNQHELW
jgi:hypothetical protein